MTKRGLNRLFQSVVQHALTVYIGGGPLLFFASLCFTVLPLHGVIKTDFPPFYSITLCVVVYSSPYGLGLVGLQLGWGYANVWVGMLGVSVPVWGSEGQIGGSVWGKGFDYSLDVRCQHGVKLGLGLCVGLDKDCVSVRPVVVSGLLHGLGWLRVSVG